MTLLYYAQPNKSNFLEIKTHRLLTEPTNNMTSGSLLPITKRNRWSTVNVSANTAQSHIITTAEIAAASVPSLLTSTKAFCEPHRTLSDSL